MRRIFNYDKESGVSVATLKDRGVTSVGRAKLHPDDKIYGNQFTGLTIAEMRAYIKLIGKRKKLKKYLVNWLRGQADYYEKLIAEEEELETRTREDLNSFIDSKMSLYKMLKNPPKKIEWEEINQDLLAESFKRSVDEGKALE